MNRAHSAIDRFNHNDWSDILSLRSDNSNTQSPSLTQAVSICFMVGTGGSEIERSLQGDKL